MATLGHLKSVLRQQAAAHGSTATQPLSDAQYSAGFSFFKAGPASKAYQDFILPQLSQLLDSILHSSLCISVLEIGPGSKSVLGDLPCDVKRKIKRYTAFEPNGLFASRLKEDLLSTENAVFQCLETDPDIRQTPFNLDNSLKILSNDKFDVILFCHSMYGMSPKYDYIRAALNLIDESTTGGMVILFHKDGPLDLNGLVPHQTACFPTGTVRVEDSNNSLNSFASFIAGFVPKSASISLGWQNHCRTLGRRDKDHLVFAAPDVMMAFSRHSTALLELTSRLPTVDGNMPVKNREARINRPASIIRPAHI